MPFFSSLLMQRCWRGGPWSKAWGALLLQSSFGMQFSACLLTFGSSWQNKASAPKRSEKTRQWKSGKCHFCLFYLVTGKSLAQHAVKKHVICALAYIPESGSFLLAADSLRFVLSWLFCDQSKERVVLSRISHSQKQKREISIRQVFPHLKNWSWK